MADSDPIILKILNGVQAGVEVALPEGEYAIGSGSGDDIQLIDVSLLAGHARLKLAGTAMEIAAGEGTLRTSSGLSLEPKGGFHAVEPLDIVTAGTTRFALGPRSANWASVAGDGGELAGPAPPAASQAAVPAARDRLKVLAIPVLAFVILLGVLGWVSFGSGLRSAFVHRDGSADVPTLRAALDAFPFGRPVSVRQEVDGADFVEGYVDTPVERRALAGAVEATGVQARIRLWVLEAMRADIKELIADQKVGVSFDLSSTGRLSLSGIILDKERADAFVASIRDRVFGIAAIDSTIKTGDILLDEVRKLVSASQLQPWLLLRLDKQLIEVDGALPSSKVDAWVGFLESYADKFAKVIPLRSFVQLQAENGRLVPAPTSAILLGAREAATGNGLDVNKLQSGRYELSDIFAAADPLIEKGTPGARSGRVDSPPQDNVAGPRSGPDGDGDRAPGLAREGAAASAGQQPSRAPEIGTAAVRTAIPRAPADVVATARASAAPTSADLGATPRAPADVLATARASASRTLADLGAAPRASVDPGAGEAAPKEPAPERPDPVGPPSKPSTSEGPGSGGPPPSVAVPGAEGALTDGAGKLLRRFRDGSLSADPASKDLYDSLVLLGEGEDGSPGGARTLPDWYLPLLSGTRAPAGPPCWPHSRLDAASLMPALFWLDLMSAGRSLSLSTLPREQSFLLLEVALDPTGAAACALRSPDAARVADHSLYLREVRRNPGFVRFLVRDMPSFGLDVAGASLGTDRFVLTQAGDKLFEGAAPDRGSRLALIGELGVVVQSAAGLSPVVYDPNIQWLVTD